MMLSRQPIQGTEDIIIETKATIYSSNKKDTLETCLLGDRIKSLIVNLLLWERQ